MFFNSSSVFKDYFNLRSLSRGVLSLFLEDKTLTIRLSVLPPYYDSDLFIALFFDGEVKIFPLDSKVKEEKLTVKKFDGLYALIFKTDEKIVTPLFCAKVGNFSSESDILDILNKNLFGDLFYDDEQIATENYYEKEGEILNAKRENFNDENTFSKERIKEEKEEKERGSKPRFNEDELCLKHGEKNYYNRVKENLNGLFSTHRIDENATKLIKNSRMVKLKNSLGKEYYAGVISEKNQIKYLVYAVPSSYDNLPKSLIGKSAFIPLSIFEPFGEGLCVIYQSATTGEIVDF